MGRFISSVTEGRELLRSASALGLSTGLLGVFGFVFWGFAARELSVASMGLLTASVSACSLLGAIGAAGLPNGLSPIAAAGTGTSRMVYTSAIAISEANVAFMLVVSLFTPLRPPLLSPSNGYVVWALIAAFMLTVPVSAITDALLIAWRKGSLLLIKNLLGGLSRVGILCFFLGRLDVTLVLSAYAAGAWIAMLGGMLALDISCLRGLRRFRLSSLRPHIRFSAANLLGTSLGILPTLLTPVLVLHQAGAAAAGYFGSCLMILGVLNILASATAQALFAEGLRVDSLGWIARRAFLLLYALLVPAVLVVFVFAPALLDFFGSQYSENAAYCLRLMALSALASGFSYFADAFANAKREGAGFVFLNGQNALLVVVGSVLGSNWGPSGTGAGWLVGQLMSAMVSGGYSWRARRRRAGVGVAGSRMIDANS